MNREARTPRFFQDAPLQVGESLALEKRISHHLVSVLRSRNNSSIILFNNDGFEYLCELSIEGKRASANVISQQQNVSESPIHTTLVQAISRGGNMDTSIQKCVELGVNAIQPIYTRHSVPPLKGDRATRKQAHWQSVITSAVEQSGRCTLPALGDAISLNAYLEQLGKTGDELRWVLSPASEPKPLESQSSQRVIVMVGPESGFDADEVAGITQYGFTERLLGPRILRTETAGPAALTVIQTLYGDFK